MVSALVLRSKGVNLDPDLGFCYALGQDIVLSQGLSPPGCISRGYSYGKLVCMSFFS